MIALVLAMMLVVAPGRDHSELARAVVGVVDASDPLFAADSDKRRTAAFVVAVLFREGSLRPRGVEGDFRNGRPTSWCSAQINISPGMKTREGWTGPDLRDDPVKCVTVQVRMLRESMRACGKDNPLGIYAEGPAGCTSARAKRISRDRLRLAREVARRAEESTP